MHTSMTKHNIIGFHKLLDNRKEIIFKVSFKKTVMNATELNHYGDIV